MQTFARRYEFSILAASALLAGCAVSQSSIGAPDTSFQAPAIVGADSAPTHHKTFYYVGSRQIFKVPPGVTKLQVVAVGGVGGGEGSGSHFGGGQPGRVFAVIPVTAHDRLYVYVGGNADGATGGFNGGGTSLSYYGYTGYGGGGASDVREDGDRLNNRILVAGGGGGQGGWDSYRTGEEVGNGGKGGGSTGGSGKDGAVGSEDGDGKGGTGGSQDTGGDGGQGADGSFGAGGNGSRGMGGLGGDGCHQHSSCESGGTGGGGGGGYYGGGGGGAGVAGLSYVGGGGGGGGGSSYIESNAYEYRSWQGWKAPNAIVVFSW
jgi:hypothetical protein